MTMKIDVYSDVICPWCYLGKKRLEAALEQWDGKADVRFLPYELNPGTPAEGLDHKAHLEAKFGGRHVLDAAHARLTALGKEVGIDYRFDDIQRTPNTFNAHRVLWLADQEGKGNAAHNAFFKAYFTDGKDLGDKKVLIEAATSAGLDKTKVEKLLAGNGFEEEVRAAEEKAYDLGIQGVPFFVFNDKLAVSGAQSLEVFKKAVEQAGS
ncbi:MAG TPA: DsbA family oxidoreductase [bacterium]|nr:DsbA family oxidoreductase [bacterium]